MWQPRSQRDGPSAPYESCTHLAQSGYPAIRCLSWSCRRIWARLPPEWPRRGQRWASWTATVNVRGQTWLTPDPNQIATALTSWMQMLGSTSSDFLSLFFGVFMNTVILLGLFCCSILTCQAVSVRSACKKTTTTTEPWLVHFQQCCQGLNNLMMIMIIIIIIVKRNGVATVTYGFYYAQHDF